MTTVFLTGGSGFLGRFLIAGLREAGANVLALARSPTAAQIVAERGAEPVSGELDKSGPWVKRLKDADQVLHAAALLVPHAPYQAFFDANVRGTRLVLKASRRAGVRRFVQIGAAAVIMGRPAAILDATEDMPLMRPRFAPYIATKSIADKEVRAAAAAGFDTAIVRPPAIWGPASLLADGIKQSIDKGQFALIDGGRALISTCHAGNVAAGAIAALERARPGNAYFVADDDAVSFRAFVEGFVGAGALDRIRSVPFWVAWQIGGLMQTAANLGLLRDPPLTRQLVRLIGKPFTVSTQKARRELAYRPPVSRAEGLAGLAAPR